MTWSLSQGLSALTVRAMLTVTHLAFGLGPRLRLRVGGLGLAVTASQSQIRLSLEAGVLGNSLPGHSDHNISQYQIVQISDYFQHI